jgi:hypothetical protein
LVSVLRLDQTVNLDGVFSLVATEAHCRRCCFLRRGSRGAAVFCIERCRQVSASSPPSFSSSSRRRIHESSRRRLWDRAVAWSSRRCWLPSLHHSRTAPPPSKIVSGHPAVGPCGSRPVPTSLICLDQATPIGVWLDLVFRSARLPQSGSLRSVRC